ncbi:hypothetical protein J0H58_28325 [bacterium]|nr:hypothetical protein [bacterium]
MHHSMSIRPPGVNLGGSPPPVRRGQPCPSCRGTDTFIYADPDPSEPPELICCDCLTQDPTAPPAQFSRLCGRVVGHVGDAANPIPVIEVCGSLSPTPFALTTPSARPRGKRAA